MVLYVIRKPSKVAVMLRYYLDITIQRIFGWAKPVLGRSRDLVQHPNQPRRPTAELGWFSGRCVVVWLCERSDFRQNDGNGVRHHTANTKKWHLLVRAKRE